MEMIIKIKRKWAKGIIAVENENNFNEPMIKMILFLIWKFYN